MTQIHVWAYVSKISKRTCSEIRKATAGRTPLSISKSRFLCEAGTNLYARLLAVVVPRATQPSIPPGSVNDDLLRLADTVHSARG